MNRKSTEERARILRCLCEGNSIRGTVRMTGASKNTIVKLLEEIGDACMDYQDANLRHLSCKRVQCDEIWAFCYSKDANVPADKRGADGVGSIWTWVAIDADTKLVPCWLVGDRGPDEARDFMLNLADRINGRFQLTTDGLSAYLPAVEEAFGYSVDYAMLVKHFSDSNKGPERKYSPGEVNGAKKVHISGRPDKAHVSTSYVERQNLTMRMSMRRFTRLTNGFSKKAENHMHAVSLHFMYYNFARPHASLKGQTPAMAAGISDHVWQMEEIVGLLSN